MQSYKICYQIILLLLFVAVSACSTKSSPLDDDDPRTSFGSDPGSTDDDDGSNEPGVTPEPVEEPAATVDELLQKGRTATGPALATFYATSPDLTQDHFWVAKQFSDDMSNCGFDFKGPFCEAYEIELLGEYGQLGTQTYISHFRVTSGPETVNNTPVTGEYVLAAEIKDPLVEARLYRVEETFSAPEESSDLSELYKLYTTVSFSTDIAKAVSNRLDDMASITQLDTLVGLLKSVYPDGVPSGDKSQLVEAFNKHGALFGADDETYLYEIFEYLVVDLSADAAAILAILDAMYDTGESFREDLSAPFLVEADPSNDDYHSDAHDGLEHDLWFVRLQAISAVAMAEDISDSRRADLLYLISEANEANPDVRQKAYEVGKTLVLTSSDISELSDLLDPDDHSVDTRKKAVEIASLTDSDDVADLLADHLDDPSDEVAQMIYEGLRTQTYLADERRTIDDHIDDDRASLRIIVARLLGLIINSSSLSTLEDQLEDETDPAVRDELEKAIAAVQAGLSS